MDFIHFVMIVSGGNSPSTSGLSPRRQRATNDEKRVQENGLLMQVSGLVLLHLSLRQQVVSEAPMWIRWRDDVWALQHQFVI